VGTMGMGIAPGIPIGRRRWERRLCEARLGNKLRKVPLEIFWSNGGGRRLQLRLNARRACRRGRCARSRRRS
jgi:hypothetical protein